MKLRRWKVRKMSILSGGYGQTWLFVHGIPGSGLRWEAVARQVGDHYRVIVPDLLGFGESDDAGHDWYFEGQARALKALLDAQKVRQLYIAAHDFGVPVTLTFLRLFPDVPVKGLVLADAHVFSDTFDDAPLSLRIGHLLGKQPWFTWLLFGTLPGAWLIHRLYTYNKSTFPWSKLAAQLTPTGMHTAWRIANRIGRSFKADYEQIESVLPRVTCPVLILWGRSDPVAHPYTGERLRAVLRYARLKVYDNSGHFIPEEIPDFVARDILAYFDGAK